jgi:hypothetical protein
MTVSEIVPAPGYRARVDENGSREIHLQFISSTRELEIEITLRGDLPVVAGI